MKLNVGNKVTRLEVIDSLGGTEYVNLHVDDLILDFQDNGRTLKIFIKNDLDKICSFGGIVV